MNEKKPAVEFAAPDPTEDDSSPNWMVFGGVALFTAAVSIALAIPGVWDEYVVGYHGRKGRAILGFLEYLGYVPTLSIFVGLTLIAGSIAVVSLVRISRGQEG